MKRRPAPLETIERRVEGAMSRKGAAYQGAFEAVIAMLIAIGIGYWVDQRFGSSPLGLFGGVALGFVAFVVRLTRLRRLLEPEPGDPGEGPSRSAPGPGRQDE